MPADTTSAAGTQVDPATQPQVGNLTAPVADAQPPSTGSADGEGTEPESITPEEAKKLRQEHQSLRQRLRAYEQAEKAKSDAEKSELDKASDRITALEAERDALAAARREDTLRLAASAAARKLGFRNPDLAYRLMASDSVEYDDAGKPKNVERLLDEVAKADPYLVQGTNDWGGGPRGTPASGTDDMNAIIRQRAGRH